MTIAPMAGSCCPRPDYRFSGFRGQPGDTFVWVDYECRNCGAEWQDRYERHQPFVDPDTLDDSLVPDPDPNQQSLDEIKEAARTRDALETVADDLGDEGDDDPDTNH